VGDPEQKALDSAPIGEGLHALNAEPVDDEYFPGVWFDF
jgi:hypothetical protein